VRGTFEGAIALVTGAGSGIGCELAQQLARRGADVVLSDLNLDAAEAAAECARRAGGRATAIALDVADRVAFVAAVAQIVERHGRLDYLFNNAGIGVGGDVRDIRHEQWRRIVEVNLWGVIHGVEAAYPGMCTRGSGHIVNTASIAGLVPFPPMTPYAMTKHAVVGLSLSLRAEGAALGVKVSAVCPAFIQSGIYAAAEIAGADPEMAMSQLLIFKPMPTAKAVAKILRGVERNRALIVFPFYARLLWWAQRINAGALSPLFALLVRRTRALRK
jgi:NAD(P)-dependent dehydrogenase (short-subunit alcohol dehydrogenase family)